MPGPGTVRRSAAWARRPASYGGTSGRARPLERGLGSLHADALRDDRSGAGRSGGLFEAWAKLYGRFAAAMAATELGDGPRLAALRYPDIAAGVDGVRWVENCVRSADAGGAGSTIGEPRPARASASADRATSRDAAATRSVAPSRDP